MNKLFALKMRVYLRVFVFTLALPGLAQDDLAEKLKFAPGGAGTPDKCGFPVVLEAAASGDVSVQALLKQRRSQHLQQNYQTYLSPLGRFRIHYLTTGFDAIPTYDRNQNGVSDYLEFVAKSFDRAWEVEIDSLGFNAPPDSTGAPHTIYPVYCKRINAYGITWFSDPLPAPPGVLRYDSYIEINTDFSFVTYPDITNDPIVRDSLAIAVTAAHEFNHALQLGYRLWISGSNFVDLWFIESSATYMEEVVAGQVNDYYYYLPCMYSSTDLNLTQNNPCNRIYGEVALPIMLGEMYGKTITRETWEAILNQPALGSLSLVLQQKGSSLNAEMRRWATWMFFSGQNAVAGQFYPEAAKYPNPEVISANPVSLSQNPNQVAYVGALPPLAFQFLKIPVTATAGVLGLLAPEQNPASWEASQLYFSEPYSKTIAAGIPAEVVFTPPAEDLYLAVISGSWNGGNNAPADNYQIALQGTGEVSGSEVLVGPNPVRTSGENARVLFLNLPRETRVEIFNANGVRVKSILPESSGQIAYWDLRSSQNHLVGSGVYIYRIVSPEKSQSGKIMVIR